MLLKLFVDKCIKIECLGYQGSKAAMNIISKVSYLITYIQWSVIQRAGSLIR